MQERRSPRCREWTSTEGHPAYEANFNAFNTAGGWLLATRHGETGHQAEFVVSEPATWIMLLCGLFAMLFCRDLAVI
jgi:hypothetical protein